MATLVVTFAFLADSQSFTVSTGAASVCAWDGTVGNPAGALKNRITGKNLTNTNIWSRSLTYEQMGVPPRSTITGITSASLQSKCTEFTTGASSTSGPSTLVDGGTTITLSTARSGIAATDASFVTTNGTNNTSLSKPSSNSVTISINDTIATGNSNTAAVTVHQDQLTFTITYETLVPGSADPVPLGYRYPIDLRSWGQNLQETTLAPVPTPFNQDDWPVPAGYVPSFNRTHIDVHTTFQGKDALPFYQTDWPVPRPYVPGIALRTHTDVHTTFLGVDALPFSQDDWPLPVLVKSASDLRTHVDGSRIDIYGLDALPFYQTDWPVPIPPKPSFNRTHVDVHTTFQGKDSLPFSQDDWPLPTRRAPKLFDDISGALSLNNQPFVRPRTPVYTKPLVPRPWAAISAGSSSGGLSLLSVVAAPFNQDDWPNPTLLRYPNDLRGFLNGMEAQLIGQDQFFGAPGQPPSYDYPNPVLVRATQRTADYSINLNLSAVVAPFSQDDWPNPRGYTPGVALRTHVDVHTGYLGQDSLPFSQDDWTNPLRYRRLFDDIADGLKLNLLQPFGQSDWPVPKGYVPGISLRTHTDVHTTFLGADTIAFRQQEWANPLRSRPPEVSWLQQSNFGLFNSFAPFSQDDWPLPRPYVPATALRTHIDVHTGYLGLDALPFAQDDWPVPRPYVPGIALRTHTDVHTTFQGKDSLPFYQDDWTNPLRPRAPDVSWLNQFDMETLTSIAAPFYQTEWPNPLRPFSSLLRTHIDVHTTFQGKDALPFSQDDWTNPLGYRRLYADIADGLKIHLLQPFAQSDWPLPRTYIPGIALRTHVDVHTGYLGLDALPFSQDDWPLPTQQPRGVVELRSWDYSINVNLNAVAAPFKQTEHPNPTLQKYPLALRTFTQPVAVELLGKDQFFGAPGQPPSYDYQNPRIYVPGVVLKTHIDPTKLTLLGLDFLPFSQDDWPNPTLKKSAPGWALSFTDTYKLNLAGQDQFYWAPGEAPTFDMTNPVRAREVRDSRTWATINIALLGSLPPFSQHEWPNPVPPRKTAPPVYTIGEALKLPLLHQDSFFYGAGRGPNYDWPNPTLAKKLPLSFEQTLGLGYTRPSLQLNPYLIGTYARQPFVASYPRQPFFLAYPARPFGAGYPRTPFKVAYPRNPYMVTLGRSMTQANDIATPLDAAVEEVTLTFDFGPLLTPGVTITAVLGITCSVYQGADSAASSRILGSSAIVTSPITGQPLQAVAVLIGTMVGGCKYLMQARVQTSDTQQPSLTTRVSCRTPQ